jgi:hypothetical protein
MPSNEEDEKNKEEDIEDLLSQLAGEDEESEAEVPSGKEPQQISIDPSDVDSIEEEEAVEDDIVIEIINQIVKQFGDRALEIWEAIRQDREQIDDFLSVFQDRISTEESTKQYYVEAVTNLLSTKAHTSTSASRILDSIARMVSATKNLGDGKSGVAPDLADYLEGNMGEGFDPDNP